MKPHDRSTAVFGILSILGLSFWFFVGFPFANHNESYVIVAQLERMTLGDAFTERIFPVANYRPLGQAVAWVGYRLSGNSIAPVEIFNYVGAVAAWLLLFFALRERRTFAVVALVAGGVLFSGYVYLYHLHGVFYSPLLISVAALFFLDREPFDAKAFIAASVTALIASFFHPYAPLLYLAAVTGLYAQRRKALYPHRLLIGVSWVIALLLLVLLAIIPRHDSALSSTEMMEGLLTSYRMVEVQSVVSFVVFLLTMVTVWTLPGNRKGVVWGLIVAAACSVIAWVIQIPLLLVWIGACMVKGLMMRKSWLVLLLGSSALLPAPAATGSPTYAVFVLLVCSATTVYGWAGAERKIPLFMEKIGVAVILVLALILMMLKAGAQIPVLSRLTLPVLAEQEKTHQMENILSWYKGSEYRSRDLVFSRVAQNPRGATNAIDRTHRPPTSQEYLWKRLKPPEEWNAYGSESRSPLFVSFGNDTMAVGNVVLRIPGRYAGEAIVALPQDGPKR